MTYSSWPRPPLVGVRADHVQIVLSHEKIMYVRSDMMTAWIPTLYV